MDPITHTLAGAALAETRLGRLGGLRRGLTLGTLLIAANLPDVDVSCYVAGSDFALGQRRGITHGVLALVVLPLALWGLTLLVDRWRARGRPDRTPAPAGALLAVATIGVWSHPLLDWLNVYGVRLLAPLDWTWFYGDGVFIVDPWLWLALGGAVFLAHPRSRWAVSLWALFGLLATVLVIAQAPPAGRWIWLAGLAVVVGARRLIPAGSPRLGERLALAALAATTVYACALTASARVGERMVRQQLEARGEGPVARVMVGPEAADPLHRQVVAETPAGYRLGRIHWLGSPRLVFDREVVPYPTPGPVVDAALRAPSVAGFVTWMRFPTVEVVPTDDGYTVHLIDVRYARRATGGFGTATVHLGPDLRPLPPRDRHAP